VVGEAPPASDLPGGEGAGAGTPKAEEAPEAPRFLEPRVVADEVRLGRETLEAGDTGVAYLLFRNAAALELLTDPDPHRRRGDAILAWVKRAGEARLAKAGLDEAMYRVGQAASRYDRLQQSRRCVPVGEAWVPEDVADRMTPRQAASVKRATALPCPECQGLGRESCGECEGRRRIDCTNPDCEDGWVMVESGGRLGSGTRIQRRMKCEVCGGRGEGWCTECGGQGSVACRACAGSGERPLCRSCGGQGWGPCRQCGGNGTLRGDPCPYCAGSGAAECSACRGDGRGR